MGKFRGIDADPGWINRRFRELERQIRELRAAKGLAASTIGSGGLTVKGGKIVVLDAAGSTVAVLSGTGVDVTGTADFSGDTSIGGDLAVTGTLSLPAGIIDNDALAEPVTPGVAHGSTGGQNFGAGRTAQHTETITVPPGFSRALVFASVSVGATATSPEYLAWKTFCTIAGVSSAGTATLVGPTEFGNGYDAHSRNLTGLSGSFNVSATAEKTAGGATAGSVNGHVTAMALFLR